MIVFHEAVVVLFIMHVDVRIVMLQIMTIVGVLSVRTSEPRPPSMI